MDTNKKQKHQNETQPLRMDAVLYYVAFVLTENNTTTYTLQL